MRRPDAVTKRALALRAPHEAVDVIRTRVVLDKARQKISVFGIVDAQRLGIPPVKISLLHFLNVGQVFAENIFQPANHLHVAFFRRGDNFGEDVEIAVIGRARLFQDGIFVELRVRRCEIPAVKIEVVFLLAVIGQRLAGNLPAGDAAAVREDGEEKRVDRASLLQSVEDLLGAFIDERNGADLNADHFFGLAGKCDRAALPTQRPLPR